jgi:hypothetical protein
MRGKTGQIMQNCLMLPCIIKDCEFALQMAHYRSVSWRKDPYPNDMLSPSRLQRHFHFRPHPTVLDPITLSCSHDDPLATLILAIMLL